MGRREAIIALADEIAVAAAIVVIILGLLKAIGIISLFEAIIASLVVIAFFVTIGYLGGKAQTKKPQTGLEAMIGLRGKVVEPLTPEGIIFVNGEYWKAESITGEHIEKGEEVVIKGYKGLLLYVSRLEEKV